MTNLRFLFSLTNLAQDNIIPRSCAMGEFESISGTTCILDRFTNELFWNFKKCRAVSMEASPYKQMSEKKFFPNVAPSPGSGPPLIYKAKCKGLIAKNQYPVITFDWTVLGN